MYTATIVAVDVRRKVFVVQVDGTVEMVTLRMLDVVDLREGMRLQGPFDEAGRIHLEAVGQGIAFDALAESGWAHRAAGVLQKA